MDFNINGDYVTVNLIWLRDNCRCDRCYNWVTKQKKADDVAINVQVENYSVNDGNIQITWSDRHESAYDVNWILRQQQLEKRPPEILWTAQNIGNELPVVACVDDELAPDDVKRLVKSLLQFGVGMVTNVSPSLQATERIVKYIGPVMHTHYGNMWEIDNAQLETYQDTAYTTETLTVHTDNTYFIEPAGLQVFHCFKPAEQGGETVLIDGFMAVELLKQRNAASFELLKTPIEWQYVSNEYHFTCVSPILNMNENGNELEQIRFNLYDRSPRVPFSSAKKLDLFYQSLKHFRDILSTSSLLWRIKLNPGTVIFINNWRVLHGRQGFSGTRRMGGCYQLMNTLLSKARMLKVIE